MRSFAIIEVEDGMTVVPIEPGRTAEDAAAEQGGVLIDPGPFDSYEAAYDALEELQGDDDEE